MSGINSAFGSNDKGYFISRKDLLRWVNQYISCKLKRVEDSANGAVICQIFDRAFPGQVKMHQVKWDAKYESDAVSNYKVLQGCFSISNLHKPHRHLQYLDIVLVVLQLLLLRVREVYFYISIFH